MENPLLRNTKKEKECNIKGTTMVQAAPQAKLERNQP